MSTLAQFLKTTLIGGLLILVPMYFSVLLLLKAVAGLIALLAPVTALVPEGLDQLRQVVAIGLVVFACFVLGLAARTRPGRFMLGSFERRVLEKIPGFAVIRGMARRLSGQSDDEQFQPVLVEIEDALTPAFIVEALDDDRFVVLVPSVPTPAAGSLYILPRARVHWTDVPVTEAVAVITRWGAGTAGLVKAMR
jgi:uncharacterized membrane protein